MEYGIRELSRLAGVSARTLRYYDEIGLLKPARITQAGYRFYGERELELLQQILFYRERDFDLKSIRQILYGKDFDVMHALEDHLAQLEEQRKHVDFLIHTVKQTIRTMKGECSMSDSERFEAFKRQAVAENEEKYGAEARERYGDEEVEASRQKIMNMSRQEWESFRELEERILLRLKEAVLAGLKPESEEAREIVLMHKEWLCKTWKQYTVEAHKGVVQLYTADERFRAYYDREVEGCAALLEQAVRYWAGK